MTGNTEQSSITIMPMCPEDLDQVMWVEQSSFRTPWTRRLFEEEFRNPDMAYYFVARQGTHVVGYMGFWLVQDEAHITNLAVHPAFRRQGVARRLVSTCLDRARELGAVRATLEVRSSNEPAQHLYQRFGFQLAAIRRGYYLDNREDALILWLNPIPETPAPTPAGVEPPE